MTWPALNPGELRNQVTILAPQTFTDISGTASRMVPLLTTYAKIEPTSGTDLIKAGQTTAQTAITVSINWQSGILSDMQVQGLNGRYVIKAIENVLEMNLVLKLICVALGANE